MFCPHPEHHLACPAGLFDVGYLVDVEDSVALQ
jgi:hypothetical protein